MTITTYRVKSLASRLTCPFTKIQTENSRTNLNSSSSPESNDEVILNSKDIMKFDIAHQHVNRKQ